MYRQGRLAGQDERTATLTVAVELAKRHNGTGAEVLSRHLAQGLPRGGEERTEEQAQGEAREAVREALARADVRQYRAEHDHGR